MFPQATNTVRRDASPLGMGACMPVGFVPNTKRLVRVMMI